MCSQLRALSWGIEFLHPNHVHTRPIHHCKHLSWRFWSHCKSFQKWKVTCNFKFPKMASFWSTFNLIFQHQRSFKWIFGEHKSWISFSPLSKKSYIMSIWWLVEKLWPNDHKVCMEVQHGITFDSKLQIGPLFLQNACLDQYFPNQPLHCMKKVHMIMCSYMCCLEGKSIIWIWLIIQAI